MRQKGKKKIGLMLFIVIIMIGTSFESYSMASRRPNTAEYTDDICLGQMGTWTAEVNGKNVAGFLRRMLRKYMLKTS